MSVEILKRDKKERQKQWNDRERFNSVIFYVFGENVLEVILNKFKYLIVVNYYKESKQLDYK